MNKEASKYLELVKQMVADGHVSQKSAEKYFPELKESESEDDGIKGAIIEHLRDNNLNEWASWFENQDKLVSNLPKWKYKKDNAPLLRDSLILNKYGCVAKSPSGALVSDVWVIDYDELAKLPKEEFGNQELKKVIEEEKSLLEKFKQAVYDCAWGKVTCKTEGETKEEYTNRWAEHFLLMVRDWADDYIDFTIQQKLRNGYEKGKTDMIEKQDEQELASTPKFKVGDWIVCCDYEPEQIIGIRANAYYEMSNGDSRPFYIIDNNHNIRLWTLADAKDGDVLAAHECIVLFKEIEGLNIKCHCTYHFMNNPSFYVNTLQNKSVFHPATKEKRDLLFQKMKEAGYEWNTYKKELKKVEQKPTDEEMKELLRTEYEKGRADAIAEFQKEWGEVDERICKCLIEEQKNNINDLINDKQVHQEIIPSTKEIYQERIDWLKSLKGKIQPQQEWSEDDKRKIDRIYSILRQAADTHAFSTTCRLIGDKECIELQDFLKSLKDRVGCETNCTTMWKPSEKQLKALEYYMHALLATEHKEVLFGLYNDLKKLK